MLQDAQRLYIYIMLFNDIVLRDTNYVCPIPPCKVVPVVIMFWLKKNKRVRFWLLFV